jgi:hypothetical protein
VNDTDPVFFYCSHPGSCINFGMVGVINPVRPSFIIDDLDDTDQRIQNSSTSLTKHKEQAKKSNFMLQPGESFPLEASPSAVPSSTTSTNKPSSTSDSSTHSTSAAASHGHPLSGGAIAGIVVAGVCVCAVVAALFFFVGRSRTLKQQLKRDSTLSASRPPVLTPGGDMYQTGGGAYNNPHHHSMGGYSMVVPYKQPGSELDGMGGGMPSPMHDHLRHSVSSAPMYDASSGRYSPLPPSSPPPPPISSGHQQQQQHHGLHEMYTPPPPGGGGMK